MRLSPRFISLKNWLHPYENIVLIIVVFVGISLRIHQYSINRSLWLDEALLSFNLIERSFIGLLAPLDHDQGSPVGFLWLQKIIITLAGPQELVLRFLPLMGGIVSLILFAWLVYRTLSRSAALYALLFFALSTKLIYYASEVKQYSTDVLATILALMLISPLLNSDLQSYGRSVLLGLAGGLLVWLSHPVIFVLASGGGLATLVGLKKQKSQQAGITILVGAIWLSSFLLSYIFSLDSLSQNKILLNYWASGFTPPITQPLLFLDWIIERILDMFDQALGLPLSGLMSFIYLVGGIASYAQNKTRGLALLLPLGLVMLAACLQLYPFSQRLLLFAAPLVFIVLANGVEVISKLLKSEQLVGGQLLLLGLCFYHPITQAIDLVQYPHYVEEIRPIIDYIQEQRQPDDMVYLYYASQRPFEYYQPRYGITADNYVVGQPGRFDWTQYMTDINQMRRYYRVWFLFSHVYTGNGANEELLFLTYLDNIGAIRVDQFQTSGAAVYLYQFPK